MSSFISNLNYVHDIKCFGITEERKKSVYDLINHAIVSNIIKACRGIREHVNGFFPNISIK